LLFAHFLSDLFKAFSHWSFLNLDLLILNNLAFFLVLGLLLNVLSFCWLICLTLRSLLTISLWCYFLTLLLLIALFWWWSWTLLFLIIFWHVKNLYLWLWCHYFVNEVDWFLDDFLRSFALLFQSLSFRTLAFFLRVYWLQSLGLIIWV
jgi:hypothetical protein